MNKIVLAGTYLNGPPDPRVEQLARWLRRQADAPGLLEAAADAIGFDALVLDRGDAVDRVRRVGSALVFEIGKLPRACGDSRRRTCITMAIRVLEDVLHAVKKAELRRAIGDALTGRVDQDDLR